VDFLERGWGELVGAAFVDFDAVGLGSAFFEEPDYALGAGTLEPRLEW